MTIQIKSINSPSTAETYAPEPDIVEALPNGHKLLNYVIDYTINSGGFGITYSAHEITTGRKVVIKENFPNNYATRLPGTDRVCPRNKKKIKEYNWSLKHFIDEAKTLSELEHSNIVTVLNTFEEHGTAYYVMKNVQGAELHANCPSPSEMNEAWLRPVLQQLLSAIKYMHDSRLYHRDIKPSNILYTAEGRAILIDFGLARKSQAMSSIGVGSNGYMPYEQNSGDKSLQGPWTDLYALGATCYRLIVGTEPIESTVRICGDKYKPLAENRELHTHFSVDFLKNIDKALELHPQNRWQSAQEWIDELEKADKKRVNEEAKFKTLEYEMKLRQAREEGKNECAPIIEQQKKQIANLISRVETEKKARQNAERQLDKTAAQEIASLKEKLNKEREEHLSTLRKLNYIVQQKQKGSNEGKSKWGDSILAHCRDWGIITIYVVIAFMVLWMVCAYSKTGLTEAAQLGYSNLLRSYLVLPGINVEKSDNIGDTPLAQAAKNGHVECVQHLISNGANVNNENKYGYTPLIYAAANGHTECVEALIKAGADVKKRDKTQRTAIDWAEEKQHYDCVRLLRNAEAY